MTAEEPIPQLPPELPHREPRPLLVHVTVDTAVVFLLTLFVLLILNVSIWVVIAVSVIAGVAVAPFTRQAEARGLERRYATGRGNPSD